jgi:hypothetical protein
MVLSGGTGSHLEHQTTALAAGSIVPRVLAHNFLNTLQHLTVVRYSKARLQPAAVSSLLQQLQ